MTKQKRVTFTNNNGLRETLWCYKILLLSDELFGLVLFYDSMRGGGSRVDVSNIQIEPAGG